MIFRITGGFVLICRAGPFEACYQINLQKFFYWIKYNFFIIFKPLHSKEYWQPSVHIKKYTDVHKKHPSWKTVLNLTCTVCIYICTLYANLFEIFIQHRKTIEDLSVLKFYSSLIVNCMLFRISYIRTKMALDVGCWLQDGSILLWRGSLLPHPLRILRLFRQSSGKLPTGYRYFPVLVANP